MSSTETKPPEPPSYVDTLFCLYASDALRLVEDETTLPLRMALAGGTTIGNNELHLFWINHDQSETTSLFEPQELQELAFSLGWITVAPRTAAR